jgi:predicted ATP-dependent endonuclease of OLD family
LGDIGGFSEVTILVEGITDQIILANASRVLETAGGPHFDLAKTSLIPYGNERALEAILAMGKRVGARCVVITDFDEQGKKAEAVTAKLRANHVSIVKAVTDSRSDLSIEDLLGVDRYVIWVNETYSSFEWFRAISAADSQGARRWPRARSY